MRRRFGGMLAIVLMVIVGQRTAFAQSLNWEGQTGVFVTPLAYSVSTGDARLSLPVVSYHYLNAGPVLGSFHQVSITMGAFNRVEFGYTGNLHQDGSTAGLSGSVERWFQCLSRKGESAQGAAQWTARFVGGLRRSHPGSKCGRRHPGPRHEQSGFLRRGHQDHNPHSEAPAGV